MIAPHNGGVNVTWIYLTEFCEICSVDETEWLIREGTFLGWGILVFFSKKALALPCVLIEKNSYPPPPPLGDRQNRDPPLTTTWYVPCGRNLRTFRL